ncbi:hypothetical protein BgAZ_302330 [Babesia gibsoni]|uniref:Uncharacterized protein n=1 Tax=Babesia gibsoni TaxID=33632 RepID=A0AAD8LHE8_BABGI|nr:hypothetical protein BgAZ_302330 [Babesia gibsoni]
MKTVSEDQGVPSGYPDMDNQHAPKFIWFIANSICVLALLLQGYSLYTPEWRIAQPITYNYMHMGIKRQHLVGVTSYGLHGIVYDNGTFLQSWQSKVNNVKNKGYTAIQYNEQIGRGTYRSFDASYCSNACRDAILVRMEGYEQLMHLNKLLSIALVVACILGGMGLGWYVLFGDNASICGGLWMSAAVTAVISLLYWKQRTYALWRTICSSQQMPFPEIGQNVIYSFLTAAMLVGASLVVLLSRLLVTFVHNIQAKRYLKAHMSNMQAGPNSFDAMAFPIPFDPIPPAAPAAAPPQPGLNPSQLFSGIGFASNQNAGYMYPQDPNGSRPSMWNTNLKY